VHVEHAQLLQFLLLLALIIAAAKFAGWLSMRAGQQAVLGEILAGVVLGPSVLNVLQWPQFRGADLDVVVAQLANVGVIFLMFIAGLETDLKQVRRVAKAAAISGTAGVFAPLLLGIVVALPFGFSTDHAIFIGITLAATSVSITVQTLIELGQLKSKEGTTLLAAAVVDDVIAIIVLSIFVAVRRADSGGLVGLGITVAQMVLFLIAAIAGGAWVMRRTLRRAEKLPVSEGLLAFVTVVVLLYSWAAEAFGQVASITGAYLAGLLVTYAGYREEIERRLHAFIYAILVPIFFISIGLQTDATLLDAVDIPLTILVIVAAVAGKIIGCGGGVRAAGFRPQEALRVGVGMISRGEVGLIVASIGIQTGILSERAFAVVVITVLASTVITPVLLRATFPRLPQPVTEAEAVEGIMKED